MPMDSSGSSRRRSSGILAIGAVLYLGLAGALPAQAQELEWATRAGGGLDDFGRAIVTDLRGNSYVTGSFKGTATFGAGEANETVREAVGSSGSSDVFVAKYARNGTLLWATSAGGANSDFGQAIAMDPRGNSYVTGHFSGDTARFGAGDEIFVAKY